MRKFKVMVLSTALHAGFLSLAGTLALAQAKPENVLKRFCELDVEGRQLTPEGRQEIAKLFVAPTTPQPNIIVVVRDFVISPPALNGRQAEFYVEYLTLGRLELSGATFTRLPPLKVRAGFDLVVSDDGMWRIGGAPPEPHLNVASAIRYATQLRDASKDEGIRKNADKTIRALKRFQRQ